MAKIDELSHDIEAAALTSRKRVSSPSTISPSDNKRMRHRPHEHEKPLIPSKDDDYSAMDGDVYGSTEKTAIELDSEEDASELRQPEDAAQSPASNPPTLSTNITAPPLSSLCGVVFYDKSTGNKSV